MRLHTAFCRRTGRLRSWAVVLVLVLPGALFPKPTVRLFAPPPGMYGLERLWRVEINNPDRQTYEDVWLEGRVVEKTKGEVFWAKTHEFDLPPGQITVSYANVRVEEQRHARGYEQFAARTGGLPPGDYSFIVWLMPELGGDTIGFESEPAGPPRLVSPRNGAELQQEPVFVWTPPMPRPSGMVSYTLKLVEVLPGQSVEEALKGNPAWFVKKGIRGTTFRYPVSGRRIEKGRKYAWQVTAEASGIQPLVSEKWGFSRFMLRPGLLAKGPLAVERKVTRVDNYFSVRLTLTNTGSTSLTNIVLTDSHRYFQCLDDASRMRVPPPGGEQISGWTTMPGPAENSVRSAGDGFWGVVEADLEEWVLPPGLSFSVRYSVFPLLTFSITGPGHTIGSGLRVCYELNGNQHVRTFNNKAVCPVPGLADAFKAADYMILTCPARIAGSQVAVDSLLVKLAELAKTRDGALCYLTDMPTTATTARTVINAFGTMMRNGWQNGYLLIVGEDNVIPAWTKPGSSSPDIPAIGLSDYDYADWNDDLMPELAVGRMLGRNATELRSAIQNGLDHRKEGIGWNSSKPTALFVSGPEPGRWLFVKDMSTGRSTMAQLWGNSTTVLHTDFITTRCRIVRHAIYALRTSGGVTNGSAADSLEVYPYEQLAAWLLDLKAVSGGKTKLDQLYPPQPGDTQFQDANGVSRRLPAAFGGPGLIEAVVMAEETMLDARDGTVYGSYLYYPPDGSHEPPAMIFQAFDIATVAKDVIVWVGHSWPDEWGDVVTGTEVQNLNISTRPVVIAFGCECGAYGPVDAVAREFLVRFASCYIGATQSMLPFGDHMLATEWWHAWSPGMSIGDGLKRLKLWNMQAAPGETSGWLQAPWMTYFVRIMNLYGDPKVGGPQ